MLPGTQLQVQTAPAGTPEPQGRVKTTPLSWYCSPLTEFGLTAKSIRQRMNDSVSSTCQSFKEPLPPEARRWPSGVTYSAETASPCCWEIGRASCRERV